MINSPGASAWSGNRRDPDAGPDLEIAPATDRKRLRDQLQQLAGPRLDARSIPYVVQHNDEFVTPDTRDRLGLEALLQTIPQDLQQLVSDCMAEAVIDVLEAVEIHEQHGDTATALTGRSHGRIQPLLQQHAVGQTRQRVMFGLVGQSCLVGTQACFDLAPLFDLRGQAGVDPSVVHDGSCCQQQECRQECQRDLRVGIPQGRQVQHEGRVVRGQSKGFEQVMDRGVG